MERQAFERHGQVDALQLDLSRHFEGTGRKVEDRLDPSGHDQVRNPLGRRRRDGDDGDADAIPTGELLEVVDVMNRDAAARLLADLGAQVVEKCGDLEPLLAKPGVVGQREAQVAGADDRDTKSAVETEDLTEVPLEIAYVVADSAHTEFAEVREVLPNLGGVEGELLGQRLRGNRLDLGLLELIETPKID